MKTPKDLLAAAICPEAMVATGTKFWPNYTCIHDYNDILFY